MGDKVFVLGRYAMKVKKTGKAMTSDWVHIFTIADGKVKTFREFLDTARPPEAYRPRAASTPVSAPPTSP